MNQLAQKSRYHREVHRRLLATVSSAALLTFVSGASAGPVVWIDVGGGLEQISGKEEVWTPDFISGPYAGPFAGSFTGIQKPPSVGYDVDSAISLQLPDSDWIFSASFRYGKATHSATRNAHKNITAYASGLYATNYDARVETGESYKIIDFAAGRDMGIGMFDGHGRSTIKGGIRFAQLNSTTDFHGSSGFFLSYHSLLTNAPDENISRKFRGIGPMLGWDAFAPVTGNNKDGELSVDWGLSAALLFGRQSVKRTADGVYHQRLRHSYPTPANYFHSYKTINTVQYANSVHLRQRNVMVPAVDAYIGASYRLPNAKISLGYRAEMFFGAIDGGIDTAQRENRSFYGPFAAISIGIGG